MQPDAGEGEPSVVMGGRSPRGVPRWGLGVAEPRERDPHPRASGTPSRRGTHRGSCWGTQAPGLGSASLCPGGRSGRAGVRGEEPGAEPGPVEAEKGRSPQQVKREEGTP